MVLNFPPVPLVKLLRSKAQFVQTVGVVKILYGNYKGKMQEHTLQFISPFKVLVVLPPGFDEAYDEGEQVEDEGVPHEVEGGGSPVGVPIVEQVVEGDAVGGDVGERKDGVEDDKETKLEHFVGCEIESQS